METLTATEWDVLDVTAREAETLEQIYESFRLSGRFVPLADAADAIDSLLQKGLLAPVSEKGDPAPAEPGLYKLFWRAYFSPTADGRKIHTQVLGKRSKSDETPGRPQPSLFGIWKDSGIHVTREDIDEVRREMWANFPRDEPK